MFSSSCRVSGLRFRVLDFGFRFSGFGFQFSGFGFRVSDLGFRISDFGLRVLDFGFRVSGRPPGGTRARLGAPVQVNSPTKVDVFMGGLILYK